MEVLVLNNSYMPLAYTDVERSICLLILGKANMVKGSGKYLRSVNSSIEIPEIICLKNVNYVKRHFLAPSRKNVFKRDNYTCQYCNRDLKHDQSKLTLDHIIPRVRFEKIAKERNIIFKLNSWENLISACKDCNSHKDSFLLEELGWPVPKAREPFYSITLDWSFLMGDL